MAPGDDEQRRQQAQGGSAAFYAILAISLATVAALVFFFVLPMFRRKRAPATDPGPAVAPETLEETTLMGSRAWDAAVDQIRGLEARRKAALYSKVGTLLESIGSSPHQYARNVGLLGAGGGAPP